jgi:hypothetical protein
MLPLRAPVPHLIRGANPSAGAVPLALTEQLQAGIVEPKVNGAVMPGAAKLTIGEPTAQKNSTVGTASAGRQPSVNQGSLYSPSVAARPLRIAYRPPLCQATGTKLNDFRLGHAV